MDATEPGRLLSGRYRLVTVIGRGGMGVVWQGRDELLNRDVAVKEILWPPYLTDDERRLACRRTIREAQMAGRVSHQNVVRIFDIVDDDGHPSIIMELLPYQSLRDLLAQDGPLPPDRAARIGLGVLAGLRAAHAEGVLHRDVKPGNILLCPDGRVVLTDFGIARAEGSPTLTATGALLGSPSYIAPERARGGPHAAAGAPGDLWGLGASLYTAVEGHPPFQRDSVLATLTAVVADEPEPPAQAGPLAPVIEGLLRKVPEQRLSADQAERMLRDIATADEAPAADPLAPERLAPELPAPEPPASEPPASEPPPPEPPASEHVPEAAPAWEAGPPDDRPEPQPPAERPRGSRLVLLGTVLLVLVAAGVTALALAMTGSPAKPSAAPAPGSHPATPAASASRTASASAAASASSAASASATPTASAATSGAAATAPASSASPAASGTPAGTSVPAGFYRYTNSTGFSIAVPTGWTVSHQGHYVYLDDPADPNTYLLIDQSNHPNADPLADWQQQQANRKSSYPDYQLIRLASVSYPQAEKAADWEFTYLNKGTEVHILNRNILANADHAYALYWSTPASAWTADYHYFATFAATFRPAPA